MRKVNLMKIGIQGGEASYHEAAARKLHTTGNIVYYETFTQVFEALKNTEVDCIIVAIANNRVQFIPDVHEQLVRTSSPYTICGEVYLRIHHALLAIPGAHISDITEVHSQAPALGQCSHFLENELPEAHIVEEHDTAGSAKLIAELQDGTKAAIASEAAGKLHGLVALKTDIQDDSDNITRFIEVRLRGEPNSAQANKTSVLLKTPEVAGALSRALKPFEKEGINLSYLQSRIIPNTAFDIDFFLEFEAGADDPKSRRVLQQLKADGYQIEVLGSYKAAEIPMRSAIMEAYE